jgi:Fur family ferric uptake transcriptional regulator
MNGNRQQVERARQRLREAGLRATPARIAVLNLLAVLPTPATHQEISEHLQPLGVDRSTVFRSLNDLAGTGLARRMELGDHVWRYEPAESTGRSDQVTGTHPHLLCVDCGSITCLSDEDIEVRLAESLGSIEDILLKGHCAGCVEKT